ncbi:MAG: hypothetical protein IKC92_00160 [Tidjanibacter sp.]|nr:hypothetical protein [Tidjanibacter sp.]
MVRFSIADHIIEWQGDGVRELADKTPNYPRFYTESDTRPRMRLCFDGEVAAPAAEPLLVHDYDLAEGRCTLHYYEECYLLTLWSGDEHFSASLLCPTAEGDEGEPLYTYHTDFPTSAPEWRYLLDHLMVFAYSLATLTARTLLIHSSTIVWKERGVMFLGESGTGKSTHTRLWLNHIEGCYLLNDDGPIIRADLPTPRVYGSPWSGKTQCYNNTSVELAAMVRLRQAPYNRITRQPNVLAFGALLPSSLPTLQKRERDLDEICTTLSELLAHTPVYILECLPDEDAAHTSHKAVFG